MFRRCVLALFSVSRIYVAARTIARFVMALRAGNCVLYCVLLAS